MNAIPRKKCTRITAESAETNACYVCIEVYYSTEKCVNFNSRD